MPSFAVRYHYLLIVVCLFVCVLGLTSVARMPVDMFPPINIPVVLVATFYSGMPPQQVEADITDTFERFFTLASGIDHMESRSMTGVSLIKVYFQPGTDANADVTQISNLAMADLRRLPQGTLPPVVTCWLVPACGSLAGATPAAAALARFQTRAPIAPVPGANTQQSSEYSIPATLVPLALAVPDRLFRPPAASKRSDWRSRCRARRKSLAVRSLPAAPAAPSSSILLRPVARNKSRCWHRLESPASRTNDHLETIGAGSHRCAVASPAKAAVASAADAPRACLGHAPVPLLATPSSPTCSSGESDAPVAASRENAARSDRNTSPGTRQTPAPPQPAARAWDWADLPGDQSIRHSHTPDIANASAASAGRSGPGSRRLATR